MAGAFQASAFQSTGTVAFQEGAGPIHSCPDPTKSYVGSYVATAVNDGCIDGLICAPPEALAVRDPGTGPRMYV